MQINIPDFSKSRVLVVGDIMLDRYWYGDTSRISPEAPVPVVHVGESEERPGGAGNVALNIASLESIATVLGLTGDDEAADVLTKQLQKANVLCNFERLSGYATVTKLRVLSRHQQLIRMDFEDGFCGYDSKGLLRRFNKLISECDAVVFSDYGKGSLEIITPMVEIASSANKPIVIDPKGTDFSRYRKATLLTPNLSEFEAVVGVCSSDEDLVAKAEALVAELELEALLITRSEKGMTLVQRNQPVLHLPTRAQEVFDVTGAGDTVVAVLASVLACGDSLQTATALANLAAGVVVGKLGTATVTIDELKRALAKHTAVEQGVVGEPRLVELVKSSQDIGESVIMTNGCFDILHPGHISYLQQARALGDRLVVAVNSDASVRELKGDSRPINSVESRMAVLAALSCVDWVVPFIEDTPERLYCSVLPNVVVKGGDYKADEVAGGACVEKAGGRVEILGFVNGFSTTDMIGRIKNEE